MRKINSQDSGSRSASGSSPPPDGELTNALAEATFIVVFDEADTADRNTVLKMGICKRGWYFPRLGTGQPNNKHIDDYRVRQIEAAGLGLLLPSNHGYPPDLNVTTDMLHPRIKEMAALAWSVVPDAVKNARQRLAKGIVSFLGHWNNDGREGVWITGRVRRKVAIDRMRTGVKPKR